MTYIKKAELASFGKFNSFEIEFKKGMNEFVFDNEFGKSTLTDFLLFILYGFTHTRKQLAVEDYLLKKYLPWTGENILSGALVIETDGSEYRIERIQRETGRGKATILDATGKTVQTELSPGEHFFGVDSDTFMRTFLIRQTDIRFFDTDGLVSALKNLVTTGDESVSFDSALAYLYKKRTPLHHKDKSAGRIYDIPREITALEADTAQARRETEQLTQAVQERAQYLRDADRLLSEENGLLQSKPEAEAFDAHRIISRVDIINGRIEDAQKKLDITKGIDKDTLLQASDCFAEQERCVHALGISREETKRFENMLIRAKSDVDNFEFILENEDGIKRDLERKPMPRKALIIAGGILAALGIALALVMPYLALVAVAGILLAGSGFVFRKKERSEFDITNEQFEKYLLSKSGIQALEESLKTAKQKEEKSAQALTDISEKVQLYKKLTGTDTVAGINSLLARLETADNLSEIITEAETQKQAILQGFDESQLRAIADSSFGKGVSELEKELSLLRTRRAELMTKASELEKREGQRRELEKRIYDNGMKIQVLEKELEDAKRQNAVLEKAIEALILANERINGMFAPKLCEKAGKVLSGITDGKYDSIYLDSEFTIRIKSEGALRELGYFSRGTADAVYLAMRYACAELISDGKSLPMIMDDPFWSLDTARLENAKKFTEKLSENSQIILFSAK